LLATPAITVSSAAPSSTDTSRLDRDGDCSLFEWAQEILEWCGGWIEQEGRAFDPRSNLLEQFQPFAAERAF
jgi:hypothetical protein